MGTTPGIFPGAEIYPAFEKVFASPEEETFGLAMPPNKACQREVYTLYPPQKFS